MRRRNEVINTGSIRGDDGSDRRSRVGDQGVQHATSGREVISAYAAGTRSVLEQHEWLLSQLCENAVAEPRPASVKCSTSLRRRTSGVMTTPDDLPISAPSALNSR